MQTIPIATPAVFAMTSENDETRWGKNKAWVNSNAIEIKDPNAKSTRSRSGRSRLSSSPAGTKRSTFEICSNSGYFIHCIPGVLAAHVKTSCTKVGVDPRESIGWGKVNTQVSPRAYMTPVKRHQDLAETKWSLVKCFNHLALKKEIDFS
jgi:hypothetical protein